MTALIPAYKLIPPTVTSFVNITTTKDKDGNITGVNTSVNPIWYEFIRQFTQQAISGIVTYNQIQDVNPNRLLGNPTSVSSVISEIPLSGLTFTSGNLSIASTGVTANSYTINGSPVFTVNAQGQLTTASNVTITAVPSGSAGGDLSSTYPNPTVSKINTVSLGSTTATSGNLLIGSGTQWVTNAISGDGTLSSTGSLTVTTTNGVAFASSATTDTTNASNISSGTLPAARLPNPSASTLGGIESIAATTHQWINAISTSGVPTQTQPAFSDISGNISTSQMNSGTGASSTTFWRGDGTWQTVSSGSGTVNSGTSGQLAYYASSTNAVSSLSTPVTRANGGTQVTTLPSFMANTQLGSNTALAAGGVFTKIAFGSANWDTGSYYSSNRYTPGIAGTYLVTAVGVIVSPTSNTEYIVAIYKNGSIWSYGQLNQITAPLTYMPLLVSSLVQLNGSTDFVEIYVYNGNITTTPNCTASYFCANWTGGLVA